MKRLVLTSHDDLVPYLDTVFPKIVASCSHSGGRITGEGVLAQLKTNQMQIWLAFNGMTIDGFVLTQIYDWGKTKTLKIFCVEGVAVEGWEKFLSVIDDWVGVVKEIEDWAKNLGCTLCEIECQPGWELLLRGFGYQKSHVLLSRDLA